MRLDEERGEGLALPGAATDGESAECDAVIALPPCDQVFPLGLTDLNEILPRQLERSLDRLGAAADVEDVVQACRRVRGEVVGEFLRDLRGEEARVRIFELVDLRAHGRKNVRMRMAEARDRGAAGRIDVFLAGLVADDDALARHGGRIIMADGPMQHVRHERRRPFEGGRT